MDWEILFKALSTIVAFYQLASIIPGSHATLKIDLEILRLLKASNPDGYESDANYLAVKAHVDETIGKTYRASERRSLYGDPDFLKGGFLFLTFFGITVYTLMRGGFTLWSLVSGFVALTGLLGVRVAVKRRRIGKESSEPPDERQGLPGCGSERGEGGRQRLQDR